MAVKTLYSCAPCMTVEDEDEGPVSLECSTEPNGRGELIELRIPEDCIVYDDLEWTSDKFSNMLASNTFIVQAIEPVLSGKRCECKYVKVMSIDPARTQKPAKISLEGSIGLTNRTRFERLNYGTGYDLSGEVLYHNVMLKREGKRDTFLYGDLSLELHDGCLFSEFVPVDVITLKDVASTRLVMLDIRADYLEGENLYRVVRADVTNMKWSGGY